MNPRYPVYVPSKGRADTAYTQRALDKIGVPYRCVVEPQEYDAYARALGGNRLIVTPHRDRGLVVTRNFIWDHARDSGTPRFWTMDDNITGFYRYNRNLKVPVGDGTILRCIEDFTERYTNVPISGMQYFMFVARKSALPPYVANTRVYSNMLIETNMSDPSGKPYRNEGFYNDDTDLCLRVLKDGLCTLLFNAFLIFKSTTMTVKGGMTPHYEDAGTGRKEDDGRWKMAKELQEKHPDVTTITRKWGRWQHHVDYSRFRRNRLRRRPDLVVKPGVDNYGMVLRDEMAPEPEAPKPEPERGLGLAERLVAEREDDTEPWSFPPNVS